jgi:hypothetical protein
MSDPNSYQVGGQHYATEYQHWDMVADAGMNYFEGQITKYLSRWRKKNGLEDLRKSLHYAEKLYKLYQEDRMKIPVCQRLMHPVSRFICQYDFTTMEKDVFKMLVMYNSLMHFALIKELLANMVEGQASKTAQAGT